jgi:hypothetical protein
LANAALLVKKISYEFKKNGLHKFGNCGLNHEFRDYEFRDYELSKAIQFLNSSIP